MTDDFSTPAESNLPDEAFAPAGVAVPDDHESSPDINAPDFFEEAHAETPSRRLNGYRPSFWEWVQAWLMRVDIIAEREQQLVSLDYAIERYPDAPANYVVRGELYLKAGMLGDAENDFIRALELAEAEYAAASWGILVQTLRDRALRGLEEVKNR